MGIISFIRDRFSPSSSNHILSSSESKPVQGVNFVSYVDASHPPLEMSGVDGVWVLEEMKAGKGDHFDGTALLVRAGERSGFHANYEPIWRGRRQYSIFVPPGDSSRGKIRSAVLAESRNTDPLTAEKLGRFFGEHMKPHRTNILCISGHGTGMEVARMPMKKVGQALDVAKRISGEQPDVLLLDACMMGNVEGLRSLQGKAGAAITSENETFGYGRSTLDAMITGACAVQGSPADVAKAMVQALQDADRREGSGKKGNIAAVDLEKIEGLASAVSALKNHLEQQVGSKKGVRGIARASVRSYFALTDGMQYGYGDLGAFLEALGTGKFPDAILAAVKQAQEKMDETILAAYAASRRDEMSSGISFRTRIDDLNFSPQKLFEDLSLYSS